jgi:hypothetical protein
MSQALAQQSSTPGCEAEFLDLICADEELLRAEFDAIIAAGWPTEPPTVRGVGRRREHPPAGGQGAHPRPGPLLSRQPDAPEVRARSRQRSPPLSSGPGGSQHSSSGVMLAAVTQLGRRGKPTRNSRGSWSPACSN